jgi:hypothetical protein
VLEAVFVVGALDGADAADAPVVAAVGAGADVADTFPLAIGSSADADAIVIVCVAVVAAVGTATEFAGPLIAAGSVNLFIPAPDDTTDAEPGIPSASRTPAMASAYAC